MCRVYSAKSKARHYFPILDWTTQDIAEFAEERKLKFHALYYDESGSFHPERRLGCLTCPLANRKERIKEFKEYPNFVKVYLRYGKSRYESTMVKNRQYFKNVYEWFVCYLFCESIQDFRERFGANLFDDGIDCKKFLEEQFGIVL